jgi:serine/threonine-protein kinase
MWRSQGVNYPPVCALSFSRSLMKSPVSLPTAAQAQLPSDPASLDSKDVSSWADFPSMEDDPLVGKTLNETYVVESVLGEGGMGRVYRAHHTRIERKKYAIKVLRPEFTRNTDVVARFRREAEAAACISHPNVVGVYDVDQTPDRLTYLVCEFLDGEDLAQYLEREPKADVGMGVHIVTEMCEALEAAHEKGVVHRDLKPHNVFLMSERGTIPRRPRVKVLDFGLSRFMDSTSTALTRTGVILGTPAYMPPEQAGGKAADHRADVYGVGAVLFTAITGKRPFEADTLQGVVLAVLTQDPPEPRALNPEIPEGLERVVLKAMAKDAADRYQSMADLRHALQLFLPEMAPLPATVPRGGHTPDAELTPGWARFRLVTIGSALLVLLIAGLSSAVPSFELLTGRFGLSGTELGLILAAITGTLLTPALLYVRRFRRTIWNSPSRVSSMLGALRTGTLVGVAAYGLASLAVRFLDGVVGRFGIMDQFSVQPGPGWLGWNLLFLVLSLLAGGVAVLRKRLLESASSDFARALLGPVLVAVGVLVSTAVLYLGYEWRSQTGQVAPPMSPAVAAEMAKQPAAPKQPAPQPAGASQLPTPAPQPQAPKVAGQNAAGSDDLALAVSKGVEGLLPLSERYPQDPAVLKPLVLAFASRATGLKDAMVIMRRLFDVAPAETRDPDLRFLVKKAAATPGEASRLAFDVITRHMGDAGPDVLYEMMLTDPKVTAQAQQLLATPAMRQRATPALLVAYDLRTANSCAARLPMLARASELGDERASQVLLPLSVGAKRGCGRWKKNPCPPPCPEEARRYSEVVARIATRLAALRK